MTRRDIGFMRMGFIALLAASCTVACFGQDIITTVAGTGASGYSGDGGPATAATLNNPWGVSALYNASSGGMVFYIADGRNNRIRRVDEAGIVSTVAGTGVAGYTGDGGAASAAQMNDPTRVSVLYNGSSAGVVLFISEWGNNCIRRVDEASVITTVAGTGIAGFSGDGGAAIHAEMSGPSAVSAVLSTGSSSVMFFIADWGNHRIRRVDEAGIITTVAGTGARGFSGDGGVATAAQLHYPYVSALANATSGGIFLYIADSWNHRIRRVDDAGIITTVAGGGYGADGGAATAAGLNFPYDVSALYNASSGGVVLYIADTGNKRIRRVDEAGNITSVAGSGLDGFSGDGGTATSAWLSNPSGLSAVYCAGNIDVVLYIADTSNSRVRLVGIIPNPSPTPSPSARATRTTTTTPSGTPSTTASASSSVLGGGKDVITTVAGTGAGGYSGDGGPATAGMFSDPSGVSALYNASSGGVFLYIADRNNHRVRRVDEGGIITTVAGTGTRGFSGDGGAATNAMIAYP
ncbi:MAG: hypothetical protein EOO65_01710, partial [Methanosarcinales archaeon]